MRVLFYGLNFSPESVGIGRYSGELATWLAGAGHSLHVITAPPYYPLWRVSDKFQNAYSRQYVSNVLVHRCPLWVPTNPTGFARLLHLASFAITSTPVILAKYFDPPDRIVVVAPAFFCTIPALLLTWALRLRGRHVVSFLHVHDFELDAAFELGLLKGRFLRRIALSFESFLLGHFNRVTAVSDVMTHLLHLKGVPIERTRTFPNWVDCKQISAVSDSSSIVLRQQLDIPADATLLLFSGTMNLKQGLDLLSAAARLLSKNSTIWWIFCGDGPSSVHFKASCSGLLQVRFLPLQPENSFLQLLHLTDIHLLPQKAGAADLVMPSKLLAMMASGRPIITTAEPRSALGRLVGGDESFGLVTPPGDVLSFVEAIQTLAANPDLRKSYGDTARSIVLRRWDSRVVLSDYEAYLCS